MSRQTFIKWLYGLFGAHIFTLFGATYYVGQEVNKNEEHRTSVEQHLTPTQLKEHFMPVEEAESEFKGLHQKLDLIIQMQQNE